MEKLLRVAEMRDLEKQVSMGKISYSRMVEIINEKHFMKLIEIRSQIFDNKTKSCCCKANKDLWYCPGCCKKI